MRHRRARRFPKRLLVTSIAAIAVIIATGTAGAAVMFGGGDAPTESQPVEATTEAAALPFGDPQGPTDDDVRNAEAQRQEAGDGATATGAADVGEEQDDQPVNDPTSTPEPAAQSSPDTGGGADSGGSGGSDDSDGSGGSGAEDANDGEEATGGTCEASNYSEPQPTASGEQFDPNAMTAAHKSLPFDTMVEVTNTANGKSVTVRINDRGPYVEGRCLDLSRAAFEQIASPSQGVATVDWQVVD